MADQRPLLIHHHVTKTAGTTFNREVLPAWFGTDRILQLSRTAVSNPDARERWRAAGPADWARYDAASGHDFVGVGDMSGRKMIRFAFFRDPIDRTVSKWFHHMAKPRPAPGMQKIFEMHGGDVVSYLLAEDVAFDYFRAFLPLEMHRAFARAAQTVRGMTGFHRDYPELWRAMLDSATQNLANLDHMLITERFEESILLLGRTIGKPVPAFKRHRSGNVPFVVLSRIDEMRPRLEARQSSAYAFMKIVTDKFERQIQQANADTAGDPS